MTLSAITHALIIDTPWVGYILDGQKDWEMRTRSTARRGRIGIIRKGTGEIYGVADLIDVQGPFGRGQLAAATSHHHVPQKQILDGACDRWPYAWVLKDAHKLARPIAYKHKPGAVIWVVLDDTARENLARSESPRP